MADPSQLEEIDWYRDPDSGKFVGRDPTTGDTFPLPLESVSVGETTTKLLNSDRIVGPKPKHYSSIQSAVDDVGVIGGGGTMDLYADSRVLVAPPSDTEGYQETVTTNGNKHLAIESLGQNTAYINGSGDHAVTIESDDNDVEINGFRIDQTDDSGDYDAIHISGREARVKDVGVDHAPRYGVALNATESHLIDTEISGGGSAALVIGSDGSQPNDSVIRGVAIKDCPAVGIEEITGGWGSQIDATIDNPGSHGAILGNNNEATLKIRDADTGLHLTGSNSTARLSSRTCNTALEVSSTSEGDTPSNNVVIGHFDGDVTLGSNSENNYIAGVCVGSLTDNGTGNDTSNLTEV